MTERQPTETTNLDRYGGGTLPWSLARELLADGPKGPMVGFFLGTVRPDGRPHAAGIGAVWHDGDLYFTSGPGTRKSRNLATNPACTISVKLAVMDLTLAGEASRVTDAGTLETLAALYREIGWPAEVAGDGFTAPYSAPSAGPPPWHLYRFTIDTAVGLKTEAPNGATCWRFARPA
jgi:hypothetical protein